MLTSCAIAVMLPVILPTLVVLAPRRWFDVDPRIAAAETFTAVGPVGFAWLCVFGVVAAIASLIVHQRCGGRLSAWAALLILPGAVLAWWHTGSDYDDLRYALTWSSAAMLGLAAFHLGQHASARRWMVALLIAAVVAMFTDAVIYRLIEHPDTVKHFENNRLEILTSQGMPPGSTAALLFERRLRTNDAVGPFGLSNVFGSVAGSAAVLALGLAWSLGHERQRGRAVVLITVAAAGAMTVWLTNSSGAMLGVLAAVFVMGLASWQRTRRLAGFAAVALVLLAIAGVVARGLIGPPPPEANVTSGASLSILFRAWYWLASFRIWSDSTGNALLGTGVSDFGQAYLIHKHPLSPEEVTSAHNVFADYIVTLGLAGLAWSASLLGALWKAGNARPIDTTRDDDSQLAGLSRPALYGAMGLTATLFLFKLRIEQAELTLEAMLVLLLSAGVFAGVLVTALQTRKPWKPRKQCCQLGLLGAAVLLLVHNQIEMTFFQPASVAWAWVVVMLAGGAARCTSDLVPTQARSGRGIMHIKAAIVLSMASLLLVLCVIGGWQVATHERFIDQAARALRRGDVRGAVIWLQKASMCPGMGRDAQALRWWLGLDQHLLLQEAGVDVITLQARADSLQRQLMEMISPSRLRASHWRMLADSQRQVAQVSGEAERWAVPARSFEQAAALSTYNPADAVAAGEAWLSAGERERAEQWFDKARELNANLYLDPAKRVPVPGE